MFKIKRIVGVATLVIIAAGMAGAGVDIEFVNIDNAGNVTNSDGYGQVNYFYRMGKTEITIKQFVASGLGTGTEDHWLGVGSNAPVAQVSWHEAARYCNWLTSGDADIGAYTIDGSGEVTAVTTRNGSAMNALVLTYTNVYMLPTENEWYKAAYYKPVDDGSYSLYAGGDSAPTSGVDAQFGLGSGGSPWIVGSGTDEQYGTFDMMGNVWEWTEGAFSGSFTNEAGEAIDQSIALRGGSYVQGLSALESDNRVAGDPWRTSYESVGFRVVAIPEPGTLSLMSISTLSLFLSRSLRRRKRAGKSLLPIEREHLCDTYCTLEEWEASSEVDTPDALVVAGQLIQTKILEIWTKVYAAYKTADQRFWDHMVVTHARRMARKRAIRASVKKKALNCFDAFLALIMK